MPTPTAFTDSQALNESDRSVKQYSDLDLFFGKKAVSNDINKVNPLITR